MMIPYERPIFRTKGLWTLGQLILEVFFAFFGIWLFLGGLYGLYELARGYSGWGVPPPHISLLSLMFGALMTGAFFRLYVVGAWHRKPIEVHRTGIKVGSRLASWQEIREIDHSEGTELTNLGPYNCALRYQTVYHVFVELHDGTELRFRLKERDFNKFIKAVAEARGGEEPGALAS